MGEARYQFHSVPSIWPILQKGRTTVEWTWWRHRNSNNAHQIVIIPSLEVGCVTRSESKTSCMPWLRGLRQRWPESLFQTPLLFRNFGIQVRQFFKFENPTPVQTPVTIINPTLIYPCFYLTNDHTDSVTAEIEKWFRIRVRFFPNFWLRIRVRKKNAESCRSRLQIRSHLWSAAEMSGLSYFAIQIQFGIF